MDGGRWEGAPAEKKKQPSPPTTGVGTLLMNESDRSGVRVRATACSSFLSTLRDGALARLALASSRSDTLPSAGFRSTSLSKLS